MAESVTVYATSVLNEIKIETKINGIFLKINIFVLKRYFFYKYYYVLIKCLVLILFAHQKRGLYYSIK